MKNKIAKILVSVVGLICLYAFLAVRFESLFNLILKEKVLPEYFENTKYGELYYYNYIKHFREKDLPHYLPKYRHSSKHPKLADADILTYGDSYFDFSRMVTFPERLGDTLHKKVYYERFFDDHRPLIYLRKEHYSKSEPKLMIYESTERYVPFRFLQKHEDNYVEPAKRSALHNFLSSARKLLFVKESELKYSVLLNRSIFTTDIYSAVSTLKFDVFGYIPETTPKYCLKTGSPWLFHEEEVNNTNTSFYYHFTDDEINTICDNIADLAQKVREKFNLYMVFMPIPSRYAIYHTLINQDTYNNFLPRIYEGLDKRGVPVIKLYDIYKNSDEILYYGTDTHWNKKGLDIALDETLKVLSTAYPALYNSHPDSQMANYTTNKYQINP
jgi:SGNH hydrolase-like domain, acetyltransferase AlgX